MPILVMKYVFLNLQKQAPWIVKPVVNGICSKIDALYLGPNIRTHLDFLDKELGKRTWLAGEHFSGADIQVREYLLGRRVFAGTDGVSFVGELCPGNAAETIGCE